MIPESACHLWFLEATAKQVAAFMLLVATRFAYCISTREAAPWTLSQRFMAFRQEDWMCPPFPFFFRFWGVLLGKFFATPFVLVFPINFARYRFVHRISMHEATF